MTNRESAKKPESKKAPASQKPDAELKDNELEQISGGIELTKPAGPRHKKPNMFL